MTFTKTLLAGLAATTLLAGAASAQDEKPFDGVYAGVETGVDWTKMSGDNKFDRSIYYGGVLGYRVQADNDMVMGLEGTFGDNGYNSNRNGVNTDYEWSASAILGQAFGNSLFYGKAGYVRQKVDYEIEATCTTCVDHKDGGWRFGGGYEYAMANGISLRTGVDYTTYGDGVKSWQGKAGLLVTY
ncbi:MAG: hypothetical protein EP335_08875 [Alphaproteobacteria bacterium]|nr:MAG: hypothetical protein EP335_08875 [Alphaproteobacteria bacterium]